MLHEKIPYIDIISSMISMEDRKQNQYICLGGKKKPENVIASPVYGIATSIFFFIYFLFKNKTLNLIFLITKLVHANLVKQKRKY